MTRGIDVSIESMRKIIQLTVKLTNNCEIIRIDRQIT